MRATLISSSFPFDETQVHGVYKRLDVFVDALSTISDFVDCYFLIDRLSAMDSSVQDAHSERLRKRWGEKISVHFAATLEYPRDDLSRWKSYVQPVFSFRQLTLLRPFHNAATYSAVGAALQQSAKVALIHGLGAMSAIASLPARKISCPIAFDLGDIEHVSLLRRYWRDPIRSAERLMVFQVASMLQAERRAMIAAAVTFVCSETDRHHLQKCIRSSPVQVIPNATTFPDLQLAPASERVVLFIGTFGYRPNVVAADTLITEIWPKILAKIPDATLVIAGRKPENLRSYTTAPFGVVFAGFVPDIATVYRTASVVCCPINSGSGTRIKIIEAASYAKPIVSTTIGAEGLMFESGREIFIEDRPSAMAERCIELLLSPRLAHDVGTAARAKAIMTYERSAIVGHVSGILQTLLSHND